MITIDENLCKKDGLCVSECPVSILSMKDSESIPEVVAAVEKNCLLCGHCVAVCPHGALSHEATPLASCPEIDKDLTIDKAQAVQFLRSRRSVRQFKDKQIERQTIEQLIKVASYAPTGSNTQMVEWVVFNDKAKLLEMSKLTIDWLRDTFNKAPNSVPPYVGKMVDAWDAGHDVVLRNAPAVILGMVNQEARNGLVDTTIALTYLDLAAPKFDLGTCWAGLLQGAMMNWPPVKEAMGISAEYPFHYPMMIGFNKSRYYRLPERKDPPITWK